MKNKILIILSIILLFSVSCEKLFNDYPDISGKWKVDITTTSSTCPSWLVPQTYSMTFTITQDNDYITAISDENLTYQGSIDNNGNFNLKISYQYENYYYEASLEGKLEGDNFTGNGYTKVNGSSVNCEAKFTFIGIKTEDL